MLPTEKTEEKTHPDQADTRWRQVLMIGCNACGEYVEPISLGGPSFMCIANPPSSDHTPYCWPTNGRKVAPTQGAIECARCRRWATFVLERLPVTEEANERAVRHVQCPTCGARPERDCFTRSSNEYRRTPHIARVSFEWLHR